MKFYQKIASIMLFAIYTTSIFGADAATLAANLPVDVEDVINEHQGENGGHWKETGHIKPYSRLLDLISYLTPAQPYVDFRGKTRRNPLNHTTFVISTAISAVGLIALGKTLFNRRFPTLSNKILLSKVGLITLGKTLSNRRFLKMPFLLLAWPLGSSIGVVATLFPIFVGEVATGRLYRLVTSRLRKKSHITQICMSPSIDHFSIYYPEKGFPNKYINEHRSLSDMKYERTAPFTTLPGQGIPPTLLKRNGLTYELKNERVNIYIDDSDDYESGDKLSTLPVERVNAFDVSTDGKTIITASEKYGIHKFDLQNTKLINKIMEEN